MVESSITDEKDRQAKISALLHSAEASIKKGELDDALDKIRSVYVLDFKNLYAHAFEERVLALIVERQKKSEQERRDADPSRPKTASASVRKGVETKQSEPVGRRETEAQPAAMLELSGSGVTVNTQQPARPSASMTAAEVQEQIRLAVEAEHSKWEEDRAFIIEREQVKMKERLLEAYRAFVMLMDVSIPKDQLDTLLLSLRGILGVNEHDHADIIRSVQVNAYVDTLRSLWQKGRLTDDERAMIAQMSGRYGITPEEHEQLTRQVKRSLGIPEYSGGILAVDDSKDILIFIEYVLKKKYPNIRTASSVQEAADAIRKEVPALILCDVMMPETGGFAFYDMIKRGEFGEQVKQVPFIFMSVCSDEYMKKIADSLGAPTYLTKPFSREVLERTIQEKIGS